MAVASLQYRPSAPAPEESKFGYVVFGGAATEYHHWVFRTTLKRQTAKKEDTKMVALGIVENLRHSALSVAKSIGVTTLCQEDGSGLDELMDVKDVI